MNAADFRQLALSFPEAAEGAHVGHPDFRVAGKIFASLGYPDDSSGVLMLTPDYQQDALGREPTALQPVKGGWGKRGSTKVELSAINTEALGPWMTLAWSKIAPKRLQKGS